MKTNMIKLLAIASFVVFSHNSYAGTNSESRSAKAAQSDEVSGRSLGEALAKANQHANHDSGTSADKKRIQELEDLVQQQQKLIELYKKQAKQP